MQDLVEGMGINRASMYQTYGNKNALFLAAIAQYMEVSLTEIRAQLEQSDSPIRNLRGLFERILEQTLGGQMNGCFVNNSAVELGPHDPDLAIKIRHFWDQMEILFAQCLKRAVEKGEINPANNVTTLARLMNTTLQGLLVKAKAQTTQKDLLGELDALFAMIAP